MLFSWVQLDLLVFAGRLVEQVLTPTIRRYRQFCTQDSAEALPVVRCAISRPMEDLEGKVDLVKPSIDKLHALQTGEPCRYTEPAIVRLWIQEN